MPHVALLGDSIFDNASYVPGEPSVIEQVQALLPDPWEASLQAVDGSMTVDVHQQLRYMPDIVSHLVISCGGNDALRQIPKFVAPSCSMNEALNRLADIHEAFSMEYRRLISEVIALQRPAVVCTIYEAIPGLARGWRTGLCLFNDVILREAARAKLSVIDLRLICDETADYSHLSPIEPSAQGGDKIARAITDMLRAAPTYAAGTGR